MIIEIQSAEEFDNYIKSNTCLVDFNAVWCGPCRMLAPNLERLDREGHFPDLKILSVDVDKVPQVSDRYGIQLIPTLFLMKNGERVKVSQGYQSLEGLINFVSK